MLLKCSRNLLNSPSCIKTSNWRHHSALQYHGMEEYVHDLPSSEWYEQAFPKLIKMAGSLKNVDLIDGKLINVKDGSTITDESISCQIQKFKSLGRTFLASPSLQQALEKKVITSSGTNPFIPKSCFSRPDEREKATFNSLTKVCNFLNVSPQQRKFLRLTICPQVTQQRIWTATLEEILKELKSEMELMYRQPIKREAWMMSEQIISNCFQFLANTKVSSNPDSMSWMRLAPTKKLDDSTPSRRWGDLLEMFKDLTKCTTIDKELLYHTSKLEAMKEGLYQIKDVIVDRAIGYKEARHQENLVQKKLTKTLGHSSPCLFTLLQYYLCGNVRDIEVEVCGGVYGGSCKGSNCLCIGRVLASDEEDMVRYGVKQLDRALGLMKFVWETAGLKGVLELQGHLWCVGAEDRTLTYRGNMFYLHGIRL